MNTLMLTWIFVYLSITDYFNAYQHDSFKTQKIVFHSLLFVVVVSFLLVIRSRCQCSLAVIISFPLITTIIICKLSGIASHCRHSFARRVRTPTTTTLLFPVMVRVVMNETTKIRYRKEEDIPP